MNNFKTVVLIPMLLLCFLLSLPPSVSAEEDVRIVEDVSETGVTTALKVAETLIQATKSAEGIEALLEKERELDPNTRSAAQKLTQQLTGEALKMLGGQKEGQDGKPAFITNYSDFQKEIQDKVYGEGIFGDSLKNACDEESSFVIREAIYKNYIASQQSGTGDKSCTDESLNKDDVPILKQILINHDRCLDQVCQYLRAEKDLALKVANTIDNELKATKDGFLPKKVCRNTSNPDGSQGSRCDIVTPASVVESSINFAVTELPALQLLNVDEFNEVVSGYMSNLTNQALNNFTGLLGLSGNSEFGGNVFGEGGNQSYADALASDNTVAEASDPTASPIKRALNREKRYQRLQRRIINSIDRVDDMIAKDKKEFGSCYDVTLTPGLKNTRTQAIKDENRAKSNITILNQLSNQYTKATPQERSAIMAKFIAVRDNRTLSTDGQNNTLEFNFINYELLTDLSNLRLKMSNKRQSCGGSSNFNPADDVDDVIVIEEPEDEVDDGTASSTDDGTATTTDDGTASSTESGTATSTDNSSLTS